MNMAQNKHFSAICCRPEVDNAVISGEDTETFEEYVYKFVRCVGVSHTKTASQAVLMICSMCSCV